MRLKLIKLAGFKSFVEPTKIPLDASITAIVGPNGCGKSNVIDAVRWVLGESTARQLRGGAMTDVIFNGSTQRSANSKAAVELVFDNASGRIQGPFAAYQEIALRREIDREGKSLYFINQSRVRRRDVVDLLSGTGLGPRSYAIIEQGMISRLIESRPEDLRVFIEEAAGIARYKERRRETETRFRHTRENLERLGDLRTQLDERLNTLRAQAEAAQHYRTFKQQQRDAELALTALEIIRCDAAIEKQQQRLGEKQLRCSEIETEITQRQTQLIQEDEAREWGQQQQQDLQQQCYLEAQRLARLQQQREHLLQRQQELAVQRQKLEQQREQLVNNIDADRLQRLELVQQQQIEQEHYRLHKAVCCEAESNVERLAAQVEQQRDRFYQSKEVEQQQRHVEQQQQQSNLALRRMLERTLVQQQGVVDEIKQLEMKHTQQSELPPLSELHQQLQQLESQWTDAKQQKETLSQAMNEQRDALQHLEKQHMQLQSRLMAIAPLLPSTDECDCPDGRPLQDSLHIESQWRIALDKVMGHWLSAWCVASVPESPGLYLLGNTSPRTGTLAEQIQAERVPAFLNQIWCAPNERMARQIGLELREGESVITPVGQWFGYNWADLRELEEGASALALFDEVASLRQHLAQLDLDLAGQHSRSFEAETSLQQQIDRSEHLQQAVFEQRHALQKLQLSWTEQEMRKQQHELQIEKLTRDSVALDDEIASLHEQQELGEAQLLALEEARLDSSYSQQQAALQFERLRNEYEQSKHQLEQNRAQQRQMLERLDAITGRLERLNAIEEQRQAELSRLDEQLEQLVIQGQHQEAPLDEESLLDEQRVQQEREQQLQQLVTQNQTRELQLKTLRAELKQVELRLQRHQGQLTQHQLEMQKFTTQRELLQQRLAEQQGVLDDRLRQQVQGLTLEGLNKQLQQIAHQLELLGAVNLGALAEYETELARWTELERQISDLEQALEILEGAIRRIDRETRSRFRTTFEAVDADLRRLFPKVFGGGHAWLDLTSDDLLEAGVEIMAQPPGKKNASIALLSGGEKALTALALVFAIFRLNPAPFCMLDEVDAPLDEVNVGRFCTLVKEMSEAVQFICISHNKISMEMADQLTGVTMQEPGVSRIVAVDIREAVSLMTS